MKRNMYMIFRKKYFPLFLLLFSLRIVTFAQKNEFVWIKIDKGHVLYLSPSTNEWIPCKNKEKIFSKTYLLTKDSTTASIYKETDQYNLPSNSYFFGNDLFNRNRLEIVSALTHIEAEQLPENNSKTNNKVIGLIYGKPTINKDNKTTIPFEVERINAVKWFVNNNYYSAALLSLKRMFIRYPQAYSSKLYVEQLFSLYDWFRLYGLLREEIEILSNVKKSPDCENTIKKWDKIIHARLSEQ